MKKKNKGIFGLVLMFAWLVLVLLFVVFYFYYLRDLPFFNRDGKKDTQAELEAGYEINSNEEINALIQEYYYALEQCNQNELMKLVIDFSAFNDMTNYKKIATVMSNYSNFTVYTLPGYHSFETIVYVTCNFDISGVKTKGLNINQFYVVNTTQGYKIDNTTLDEEVAEYINLQRGRKDIQQLYKDVYAYIETSANEDPYFKKFVEEYGILN